MDQQPVRVKVSLSMDLADFQRDLNRTLQSSGNKLTAALQQGFPTEVSRPAMSGASFAGSEILGGIASSIKQMLGDKEAVLESIISKALAANEAGFTFAEALKQVGLGLEILGKDGSTDDDLQFFVDRVQDLGEAMGGLGEGVIPEKIALLEKLAEVLGKLALAVPDATKQNFASAALLPIMHQLVKANKDLAESFSKVAATYSSIASTVLPISQGATRVHAGAGPTLATAVPPVARTRRDLSEIVQRVRLEDISFRVGRFLGRLASRGGGGGGAAAGSAVTTSAVAMGFGGKGGGGFALDVGPVVKKFFGWLGNLPGVGPFFQKALPTIVGIGYAFTKLGKFLKDKLGGALGIWQFMLDYAFMPISLMFAELMYQGMPFIQELLKNIAGIIFWLGNNILLPVVNWMNRNKEWLAPLVAVPLLFFSIGTAILVAILPMLGIMKTIAGFFTAGATGTTFFGGIASFFASLGGALLVLGKVIVAAIVGLAIYIVTRGLDYLLNGFYKKIEEFSPLLADLVKAFDVFRHIERILTAILVHIPSLDNITGHVVKWTSPAEWWKYFFGSKEEEEKAKTVAPEVFPGVERAKTSADIISKDRALKLDREQVKVLGSRRMVELRTLRETVAKKKELGADEITDPLMAGLASVVGAVNMSGYSFQMGLSELGDSMALSRMKAEFS